LSCLLEEQLLEPALNVTIHCCGREFRVLNCYDQKSFVMIKSLYLLKILQNHSHFINLQLFIMTTQIATSTTDSQMHNNIMAAGSRDRPPMLATGRYAQWRSRFLRYIDTRPNGDALRTCILEGPYTPTTVVVPTVPATENSPAVPEQTTVETVMNMTPE
ncbi:hypothetical protein Tco_0326351, partial [Tanacetum coccineum]